MERAVLERRQTVAEITAAVVRTRLDHLVALGSSWAERPVFRQLVAGGKWQEAILRLEESRANNPDIERLFMADLDGILTADTPVATPSVIGQSRADKDWHKGITKGWQPYVSEIYQRGAEPKYNIIAVAIPVKDEARKPVGVLVLQVKLESVIGWLAHVQPEPPGIIYIADQHGNVMGHPWYPPQGTIVNFSSVPVVQRTLNGQSGIEQMYDDIEKEEVVAAYAPVADYGWGVVLSEPARSVFSAVNRQVATHMIIYGLLSLTTCLFAVVILYVLSRINRYRQELDVIMGSAGDSIVAIDRSWNIVLWNRTVERLSGWSKREVLGRPMRDHLKFVNEDSGKENIAFIEEAMLNGEPRTMANHTVLVTKDGRRVPVGDSAAPIFGRGGAVSGAVIIFRDVSTERELAGKREALTKLKDDFLFKTVHDLRSPSSVIKMAISSCGESDAAKDPDVVKNLDFIKSANARILKLIDDLLQIGQEADPKFVLECRPAALKKVVDAVLAEVVPKAAAKRVSIVRVEAPEPPDLMVNEGALQEVFVNLMDNAIKYNKEGGQVTIGHEVAGRMAQVWFQDTGCGIPAEFLDRLFVPYFRAGVGKDIEGTGLGLYIVKNLVEKMDGSVAVNSTVGQGTRFTVSLPLA